MVCVAGYGERIRLCGNDSLLGGFAWMALEFASKRMGLG